MEYIVKEKRNRGSKRYSNFLSMGNYNPKLMRIAATIIAPTITKKSPQPLIPWAVFLNGCPHLGQETASFDTSVPHEGQFINAILPPFNMFL